MFTTPKIVRFPYNDKIYIEPECLERSYVIWACSESMKHRISILTVEESMPIEDVINLILQQSKLPGVIRGWFE